MFKRYSLTEIKDLHIDIRPPCIVFLKGDLGAGKTTLSQYIIKDIFGVQQDVTSPTYTYYNKYISVKKELEIYHFDLYRISDYEEFIHIGGEEILDNNEGIILIEWPEILGNKHKADIEIILKSTEIEDEREIEIIKN